MWAFRGRKGKREIEIISIFFSHFTVHNMFPCGIYIYSALGAWGASPSDRAMSTSGKITSMHKWYSARREWVSPASLGIKGWDAGVGCGEQEEKLQWRIDLTRHFGKRPSVHPMLLSGHTLGSTLESCTTETRAPSHICSFCHHKSAFLPRLFLSFVCNSI